MGFFLLSYLFRKGHVGEDALSALTKNRFLDLGCEEKNSVHKCQGRQKGSQVGFFLLSYPFRKGHVVEDALSALFFLIDF